MTSVHSRQSSRKTAATERARRALVHRWQQLNDDLANLKRAVLDAPEGTFTDGELQEALDGLYAASCGLENGRPLLPVSRNR